MGRRRPQSSGEAIAGMLLLDKPAGITSNGALQEAKRLLNARKGGHTGSLDPIATGLLPLCFGSATKLSGFFLGADKKYWAKIRLGEATDTGDAEGTVLTSRPVGLTAAEVDIALDRFRGPILQTPPMYSAIKVNGQPLYKLAREGKEIERQPRAVTVHELELTAFEGRDLELNIDCSSGFYVRGLAHDLGERLGVGGHVVALRRVGVGTLKVSEAVTLQALLQMSDVAQRRAVLIPPDLSLAHLPTVDLSVEAAFYLCRGQPVRANGLPESGLVRLYARDVGFLGIGNVTDDMQVAPRRLIVDTVKSA